MINGSSIGEVININVFVDAALANMQWAKMKAKISTKATS